MALVVYIHSNMATKQYGMRLPELLMARVGAHAALRGISRTAAVTDLLEQGLESEMSKAGESIFGVGQASALEWYGQEYCTDGYSDWGWRDAIVHAQANGWKVNKFNDPTEDARDGLTADEAEVIANEDSHLIWLSR